MSSLIPVQVEALNSINQKVEEWEEIEFMVDSGAGHTVICPEHVNAMDAEEPEADRNYKLADGSLIPHMGSKKFQAVTEDNQPHVLNAQITPVDEPLLSVSQIVLGGHTVVFSPTGSYIDLAGARYGSGEKLPMRLDGNTYKLTMWVPREQPMSFQGPAQKSP